MNKFNFLSTPIEDLYIVEPVVIGDGCEYFMETFNSEFLPYVKHIDGTLCNYVQDNESFSKKGVLRGLHTQLKSPQGKLVRVLNGAVYDVAVDVRYGSKTYGQYFGITLTSENKKQLLIPEGFLHGFLVLSDEATFAYKCTRFYNPSDEFGVLWNDPDISVKWPIADMDIFLAEKDLKNKRFTELVQVQRQIMNH